jgi:hypothetical protein
MIVKSKYFAVLSGESDADIIRSVKPLYDSMNVDSVKVKALQGLLNKVIEIDRIVASHNINYNWSASVADARSALAVSDQAKSLTNIIPGESAQDFVLRVEAICGNSTPVIREALEGLLAKVIAADIEGPIHHNWSRFIDDARSALGPSLSTPSSTSSLSKRILDARVELLRARGDYRGVEFISGPAKPWY